MSASVNSPPYAQAPALVDGDVVRNSSAVLIQDLTNDTRLLVPGGLLEAQQKHASVGRSLAHREVAEVLVHGNQEPLFRGSEFEDLPVRHTRVDVPHG